MRMKMRSQKQNYHLKLLFSIPCFFLLLSIHHSFTVVSALNIGVQSINGGMSENKQQCSRKCESEHCTVPPFLRYGKYCGILYSGCPGEKPCDGLDACCQTHDACVQAKHNDYLSQECNENLLDCIEKYKESGAASFKGNKCMVQEVVDVITVVIEAALLAGRVLHKP